MDVHSPETRSYNMSCIKSKGTKPEITIAKALFSRGYRYRKNVKKLPGCPDLVFPKYKSVVFINGCFWHMHEGCKRFVLPKTNTQFWLNKLDRNHKRDLVAYSELKKMGWHVCIVWECQLEKSMLNDTIEKLAKEIKNH